MENMTNPTCQMCDAHYHFEGKVSMELYGVMMQPCESYCVAGKRARRFRASDPKRKPPAWCPRRKSPCEFRIYGFISEQAMLMHLFLASDIGDTVNPYEHRYGLRYEGVTELTPKEFWRRLNDGGIKEVLPVPVQLYEIVEVDDGLKPVCFYRALSGYRVVSYFKTSDARKRTAYKETQESEVRET